MIVPKGTQVKLVTDSWTSANLTFFAWTSVGDSIGIFVRSGVPPHIGIWWRIHLRADQHTDHPGFQWVPCVHRAYFSIHH
jgi:hypothetical protein